MRYIREKRERERERELVERREKLLKEIRT